MAKMKLSPTVDGLSGKLGNMVHRQLWGVHVVSRVPDLSDRVLSAKQQSQINQYKSAGFVWKSLPGEVKAAYRDWGKQLNKPPYTLFNKNYSRPPIVEDIDVSQYGGQAGQAIVVRATDLFAIASVEVAVRQVGGRLVEKGAAIKAEGDPDRWIYRTTATESAPADLVIEAEAVNWPGKRGNRLALAASRVG